jgi:hypothetical protein
VVLEAIESYECPKSRMLRDPESQEIVQMFNQEQVLKGMGSAAKWPGALYDAFLLLENQRELDKRAVNDAVQNVD